MESTAVNSLIEALLPFIDRSKTSDIALHLMIEEHLAMEKEQIMSAFDKGLITENVYYGYDDKKAEQYYNETFKSE